MKLERPLAVVAIACSALGAAIGALAMTGWITGSAWLVTLSRNSFPVQFNTALGLLLCAGAAAAVLARRPTLASGLALVIVALAALSGLEVLGRTRVAGTNLIFDASNSPIPHARLAPNTVVTLLLTATALILLAAGRKRWHVCGLAAVLASIIAAVAAVSLSGYAVGLATAYQWGGNTPMSLPSALGMLSLSLAIVTTAWSVEASRGELLPAWISAAALAFFVTASVLLFQALQLDKSLTAGWSEATRRAVWFNTVCVLVFGVGASVALSGAVALARTARQRALDVAETNRRLAAEMEQRQVATEGAKQERRRLHDVLDGLPAYVILLSADYQVPFANRYFEERFGASAGRRCYEYLFQRTAPCENCESFKVFETHAPHHWEWTGPDARHYDIQDVPFIDMDGTPLILETGIDISDRKAAEVKLAKVNRALRLVSACNQALAHAGDESEVLQRICDLAVDIAGYRLVWIGYAELDEAKTVRAVAKSGEAVAYVQPGFISWADEARGRGPTGTAIRTARPALCRDTRTDDLFAPWRDRATEFGFCSTLVVPLLRNGAAFGSISIYAATPDAFNNEEIGLFAQLADDLSFAVGALRMRVERETMEQRLRFLASAVESSDDAIYTKGLDGQIRSWNRGAERLYGYSQEEIIGQHVRLLAPPERPVEITELLARLSRGENVEHYETVRRRKDGTLLDVSLTLSPIHDENGIVVGASSIARDITERKRREEALRASERKFRTLVENIPQRIAIKDRNSTYLSCNEKYAAELGVPSEEIRGKTDFDFYPAELAEKYRADDARVIDTGELVDLEESYVVNGAQLDVQTVKVPLRGQDGAVNGVLIVFWDITARKRAERELTRYAEELKRSNDELQEFAFVASHDLQEPLRKITAFSERLRDRCGGQLDEVSLDFLHRMHNAAMRMGRLIDSLLEYSRLATRALPFEDVDLAATCVGVIADLEQRIRESGARITVRQLPKVIGDPVQLRQLLQNLLANALKFHPAGQRPGVAVWSMLEDGRWRVSVSDNGIGFEPQFAERIFRPFQRLHGRTEYEGSGMGLAICRKIAQRHGATIEVETEPGKGSTFTIVFPATRERTQPWPNETQYASSSPRTMTTTSC